MAVFVSNIKFVDFEGSLIKGLIEEMWFVEMKVFIEYLKLGNVFGNKS